MKTKISLHLDKETIAILDELKGGFTTNSDYWRTATMLARFENDLAAEIKIVSSSMRKKNPSAYLLKQTYHRVHRILRYVIFRSENSHANSKTIKHPSGFLLRATLPPDVAEERIANFENLYEAVWTKKHCAQIAKIVFYCQMVRAIFGHHTGSLRDTVELLLKLKK